MCLHTRIGTFFFSVSTPTKYHICCHKCNELMFHQLVKPWINECISCLFSSLNFFPFAWNAYYIVQPKNVLKPNLVDSCFICLIFIEEIDQGGIQCIFNNHFTIGFVPCILFQGVHMVFPPFHLVVVHLPFHL
jgi:hypothetical protein